MRSPSVKAKAREFLRRVARLCESQALVRTVHFQTDGACEAEFHLGCKQTTQVLLNPLQHAILATPCDGMIALSDSKTRRCLRCEKHWRPEGDDAGYRLHNLGKERTWRRHTIRDWLAIDVTSYYLLFVRGVRNFNEVLAEL